MIDAIIRNDGKVDINSSLGLTAALVMAVVGPEVFIVQPGFVQGLVAYLGFSDQKAGFVASAEMFGIAATTILLTFAASRFNWRVVCAGSLLVMAVANLLCVFTDNLALFTALRVLAGLGAGGLVSLSFTIVGLTAKPDRNFGYL
ncbi:MAG TPA: MFS transporter, partial [Parvularculaceae bacterium]|nr:MFS transporter [Parvularculaceae bacterium]